MLNSLSLKKWAQILINYYDLVFTFTESADHIANTMHFRHSRYQYKTLIDQGRSIGQ